MIHSEHPFQPDPADREQARRFRGRLAAGVTIVTAGSGSDRTGLTVSSLLVVQGEPAEVHLVVGPTTDLWDVAADSGHFVIHICRYEDHQTGGRLRRAFSLTGWDLRRHGGHREPMGTCSDRPPRSRLLPFRVP